MAELSGSELRIVHFVLYNTYGYNRNIRTLTASYISKGTGIAIRTVRSSLNSLVEYKVLFSIGAKASAKMFGINKFDLLKLVKNYPEINKKLRKMNEDF